MTGGDKSRRPTPDQGTPRAGYPKSPATHPLGTQAPVRTKDQGSAQMLTEKWKALTTIYFKKSW